MLQKGTDINTGHYKGHVCGADQDYKENLSGVIMERGTQRFKDMCLGSIVMGFK